MFVLCLRVRSLITVFCSFSGWCFHLQLVRYSICWVLFAAGCFGWSHHSGLVVWNWTTEHYAHSDDRLQAFDLVDDLLEVPDSQRAYHDHRVRWHGLERGQFWWTDVPHMGRSSGVVTMSSHLYVDSDFCCQKFIRARRHVLRGKAVG